MFAIRADVAEDGHIAVMKGDEFQARQEQEPVQSQHQQIRMRTGKQSHVKRQRLRKILIQGNT